MNVVLLLATRAKRNRNGSRDGNGDRGLRSRWRNGSGRASVKGKRQGGNTRKGRSASGRLKHARKKLAKGEGTLSRAARRQRLTGRLQDGNLRAHVSLMVNGALEGRKRLIGRGAALGIRRQVRMSSRGGHNGICRNLRVRVRRLK